MAGRPLDLIYPILWLDAIHYKVRENGKVISKAVHTILGVNLEGRKEEKWSLPLSQLAIFCEGRMDQDLKF